MIWAHEHQVYEVTGQSDYHCREDELHEAACQKDEDEDARFAGHGGQYSSHDESSMVELI